MRFYLRTRPSEETPADGVLLDWFGRGGASTVSARLSDLIKTGDAPSPLSLDLLRLAITVYGADKLALREAETDRWTRSQELNVPVSDPAVWGDAAAEFSDAL